MRTSTDISGKGGFSLLEVLITVVLISVLAGIVTVNAGRLADQAEYRYRLNSLDRLVDAARREAIGQARIVRLSEFASAEAQEVRDYVSFDETASVYPSGACVAGSGVLITPRGPLGFSISQVSCAIRFG